MSNSPEQERALTDYRGTLLKIQEEMQSEFDKTVLALSGGAIALSITLIKELMSPTAAQNSVLLMLSWFFWALSITFVLCSYFTSAHAMESTITELDRDGSVSSSPGGLYNMWTRCLNLAAGIGFIAGLVSFLFFVATTR